VEQQVLYSYQIDWEGYAAEHGDSLLEYLMDVHFKGDETNLLLTFLESETVGFLNLRTGHFKLQKLYYGGIKNLQSQFLVNFPGNEFFIASHTGTVVIMNENFDETRFG